MVYIKRMVMQGFKSFARRTEIVFDGGINVILGPNGSGKSNISDALCFVLGRLSIKSMRAARAQNLLFMGSKYIKPAHESTVEIVFDNEDGAFSINKNEVHLKRIVRRNGQSIYKVNDETKTRTEVIEMLAQAGIDPYGFNMVMQGQIQSIVKMHPEERRKIIEEVAGISIYESRKEKSLHELEKTDEKLKEITAILRERTAYLRNLERERAQALRFKELETIVKRCKASIITKKKDEKLKELSSLDKSIGGKTSQKDKIREKADQQSKYIEQTNEKINEINKHIQQATGIEQETLHTHIANLKAELEGIRVRRENQEHRKSEIEKRINEMTKAIPELEDEIKQLRERSPIMAQKAQELRKKKSELAEIELERKRLLTIKTELHSFSERTKDKERNLARVVAESESLLRVIEEQSRKLKYIQESDCQKALSGLKASVLEKRQQLAQAQSEEVKHEKIVSVAEADIKRYEKIKSDVKAIDVCPLCQSKITGDHLKHVNEEADQFIRSAQDVLKKSHCELEENKKLKVKSNNELHELEVVIAAADLELVRHRGIKEKHEQLKNLVEQERALREESAQLEEKRKNLESKMSDVSAIEEKYDGKILEIEEISSRTEDDVDTSLLYKEREKENMHNIIKRSKEDVREIENILKDLTTAFHGKSELLKIKEKQEEELNEKFDSLFKTREQLQREVQEKNLQISELQTEMRQLEDQINYLKIGKAKLDAEREALEMELADYLGVDLIQGSLEVLDERLKKTQEALQQIGSINMRALEVYDGMKKEYDAVFEKVQTLEKEKLEILKIIEEIDAKKTRTFMKTFRAMNEIFTQNFAQLYNKGTAYLDLENKENIFEGGVSIVVKVGKGKYFDVSSLSGGEQTLVALSLLFAIQEYKPYHFYVFDEIDAALDKRNSERLAGLLQKYMRAGQYIIITHNDAIILNSNILYGVSMHDGVSKILSLNIKDEPKREIKKEPENKEEINSQSL